MASNNENKAQLINRSCASMEGKSPNLGCDFEYDNSDVGSIFYPYSTHESEDGYETYSPKSDNFNPSLDDSSSTHHQEDDHEHEIQELDGILELDEFELMVEDDYGDISVSDEYSGSEINPQYDQFEHESSRVDSICDSCDAHESEQGHERHNSQSGRYTPHRDDSSSTHHQDDDDEQESDELDASFCPASPEPSSSPRLAFYFDCKLCLKMAREPVVLDSSIVPIRPTPVCNIDLDHGLNLSPRPNGGLFF
ncbi:hypothetical protein L3X38_012873 [Prunus dulcis]|uniref:Uncharacterized protein n=1 Tax=Prunus dulcis TaxID=3755 RepID=A0AAD4WKW8_PRUDU|nr:hypothetical protein L3X38_012873 [Prunus dulcis]